ncbi:substrate-binding domain-containing protein, partial [bacterium]|nr:substrate-binding domain-containing protein [bacterium]
FILILMFVAIACLMTSCSNNSGGRDVSTDLETVVLADISLKPPLEKLAENYSYVTNYKVRFIYAPSNLLLNSPDADSVDLFLFANDQFIEPAREMGLADTTDPIHIAYTVPCLLAPSFNLHMITNLSDLDKSDLRIGIADPETDILGQFSLELLKKNGYYKELEHRLVYIGPSALDLADRVAKIQLDVAVGWTITDNWYPESFDVLLLVPNEIPRVAVVTAILSAKRPDPENAKRLVTYLKSDRCADIFRNWGYLISNSDVNMYAPTAEIGGMPEY